MTSKIPPSNERHVIVVALDSTLADHAGSPNDTLIQLLSDLCEAKRGGYQVVVVSDKVPALRGDVLTWLNTHVFYYDHLVMRPEGSFTTATALMKARIDSAGAPGSRMPLPSTILCAFDARADVRLAWAAAGVPCLVVPTKEGWQ